MDLSLIQGTITGLKIAGEIAQSILQLKSMSDVQGKVIELQSAILSAQSSALSANAAQTAMVEEIRALKENIARMKAWDTEKVRYILAPIVDTGAVAYALKKSMSNSEPPHYLCTNCYDDGRKSILSPHKREHSRITLCCPRCKNEIHMSYTSYSPEYSENC
jgi:hypothetical protein